MNIKLYAALAALLFVFSASCEKKKEAEIKALPAANQAEGTSVLVQIKNEIAKDPSNVDLWFHLADLYERETQYKEQIDALKKVVELDPDKGFAYFKLGTAYNRIEGFEDAERSFEKSLALMPNYAVTYNNLAYTYGEVGKTDKQIGALKKAISLRKNYSTAIFNLGIASLKKGDIAEAKRQYEILKEQHTGLAEELLKKITAYQ